MKKAKKILALILALAMVFSLVACGSSSSSSGTTSNSGSSSSSDTSGDSDGDSTASGDNVIQIGVLLPMSGSTSYYGEVQYNGIEFCVNYVNENGLIQIDGETYTVELVLQDSAGDPETGMSAFELLADNDDIVGVVGPYNSTVAAATAPLAIQYGIPYIICNATSENFMGEANKYVYRTNVGSSDGDSMWLAVIDYLNEVRPDNPTDTVAIVYDEGDWGSAAVQTWRTNAEAWGYSFAVDEAVAVSTTDMSTLVSKIKAADVDLVIVATFSSATNLLVKTMSDYDCGAYVAGLGGGVGDTSFIEECGSAAEGVLYTAPWVPSWGGASDEVNELAAAFADTYGYEMTMEPAWGWLAIATLIEGIIESGSTDREAIADALYDIDIDSDSWVMMFSGYDGINFNTDGETSDAYGSTSGERYNQNSALGDTAGMVLIQVIDGEWTAVYPTTYTDGEDVIIYE